MGAPNFYTMAEYPLFAREDVYTKFCDKCCLTQDATNDTCEFCGEALGSAEFDYDLNEDYRREETDDLEEMCKDLKFLSVVLKSGYFAGVQLYVELTTRAQEAGFIEKNNYRSTDIYRHVDNEECHYYFEVCRSKAIKMYEAEQRKVLKIMRKFAEAHGFEELRCVGIFSNGEAIYERTGKTA